MGAAKDFVNPSRISSCSSSSTLNSNIIHFIDHRLGSLVFIINKLPQRLPMPQKLRNRPSIKRQWSCWTGWRKR